MRTSRSWISTAGHALHAGQSEKTLVIDVVGLRARVEGTGPSRDFDAKGDVDGAQDRLESANAQRRSYVQIVERSS